MDKKKKKRIVNKELLEEFKKESCIICYRSPCDPCHIRSVGAGGPDEEFNLFPACREHHGESHQIGILTFALKYQAFYDYLISNGWYIDGHKLIHPKLNPDFGLNS